MQIGDNLHECQILYSEKNKKKMFQFVVSWKYYPEY